MLIVAGPQGSGNHMWSKIFALHPQVFGWQALLDQYWIGHDQEPFAACWEDPAELDRFDWNQRDYYVSSISLPYMNNGERVMPDLEKFASRVPIPVSLVIIGRDRNIAGMQQQRVRGEPTYQWALDYIDSLTWLQPRTFLSFELLHLYRSRYLRQLSTELDFPIAHDDSRVEEILRDDSNQKYFQPIKHHWVDDLAKQTSRKWR